MNDRTRITTATTMLDTGSKILAEAHDLEELEQARTLALEAADLLGQVLKVPSSRVSLG